MLDRRLPAAAALLALAAGAVCGGGCRKSEFLPGVYELVGVFQVARDADGAEESRSELRVAGGATWTFDYDGEFLVAYDNYGVGFERTCSGQLRGQYTVDPQQLAMTTTKASVPAYCRPDAQRHFTWQRGWGDTLTVERHYEGNQYMAYRLEPVKE